MKGVPQRAAAAVAVVVAVLALLAGGAAAQSVDAAVDDLRGNDVTFEEGAVGDQELQETADAAASFAVPGAFFKVIILATDVSDFRSAQDYAAEVLDALGGTGRVQVISPNEVGIGSNVDTAAEVADAERAGFSALENTNQAPAAVIAAGDVLGVADPSLAGSGGGSSGGGSSSSDGGGRSWLGWLLLAALVIGGIVLFLWFVSRNKQRSGDGTPASTVDVAAQKVRAEVDRAANLIIELNDAQGLPGFTDEAKTWFRQGATMFADLQDDLEEADTRAELEAVWPKLKECTWKLGGAKDLAAGRPAPALPPLEPLIPQTTVFGTAPSIPAPGAPGGALPPPPPGGPVTVPAPMQMPVPGPGYQQTQQSPWLSQTAVIAMSVLAAQGIGNARQTRSGRSRRPPSNDDWFGDVFGGGGSRGGGGGVWGSGGRSSGGSRRPSGGGRSGRVGRGMGRRR